MDTPAADTAYRICFLCSGNICRSPMGEIVLRAMIEDAGLSDRVAVDSAGTGDWHVGDPADPRTLTVLERAGYDGSAHRAGQIDSTYLERRDLILAADNGHVHKLERLGSGPAKIALVRSFDDAAVRAGNTELDDPYFGEIDDFERCLQEVESACRGVVRMLQQRPI
ncbi:low molecular weight protein-tyrosine-phosphatase [Leekyejoonella antrihumi]|uniref:protein-tyrosine-phosphatase n=1 Tax=Leekyejoonella antrihumi TaxID=1660198 RepID=A0A563E6H0_9MICO|nr:low molecular weight protein-tyrosine-phosphatase [Leekyejoonella antrihumi]TWP37899.1 low molecular weight phosphotyrosine protein phosphatase [Leekyejoonella antrihumi]